MLEILTDVVVLSSLMFVFSFLLYVIVVMIECDFIVAILEMLCLFLIAIVFCSCTIASILIIIK